MKYAEIEKLLDKGFTPDQIMALAAGAVSPAETAPAETPADPAAPETVEQSSQPVRTEYVEPAEPEWAKKLNENINGMKRAIQAQNIAQDLSNGEKPVTAEDVLLEVIGNHNGGSHG